MRIAVDAMGGDFAPHEIVKGSVDAALKLPGVSKLFLVGDKEAVERELRKCHKVPKTIEVRHAAEVIAMEELPAQAVRRKKDSSIGRSIDLVKAGEADAIVSAGHTGAAVAAAMLKLRTLEGVDRPAIAAVMPTQKRPFVILDVGATVDSQPALLVQFAVMGSIYAKVILGQKDPVVGLLSIGGEDVKGNETTKEAFRRLAASPLNFRGNVEGHDLFKGDTDVVVCDGFVGNVVLKTSESVAHAIGHWMKEEFTRNPLRVMGATMLRGALKVMKKRMDPELYGGAPLLGVNGIVIITHGASTAKAIFHAVRVACESAEQGMNELIVKEVGRMGGIG